MHILLFQDHPKSLDHPSWTLWDSDAIELSPVALQVDPQHSCLIKLALHKDVRPRISQNGCPTIVVKECTVLRATT